MTFGWRVLVTVPAVSVEMVSDWFWSAGAMGIEEQGDDPVLLLAGFASEADAAAAAAAQPGSVVESIEDDSYNDEWRLHATATRVGPILIQPTWLPADLTTDASVIISIDPGRSFGSGSHPSTRLAVEALWAEPLDGAYVLDVGCGSGILSIVAAKRGAARVLAIDVDEAALEVTMENAHRNGVADRVLAVREPLSAFATTFDTVLANLPGHVAREMAGEIADVVVPGGSIVVSGMAAGQLDGVREAFVNANCVPREVLSMDDWVAVVFDRSDPAAPAELDEEWFADTPWADDAPLAEW